MSVAITIQQIDDFTAAWIRGEAERLGVNVETVVITLIHQAMQGKLESPQLQVYYDLDALAGTWSREETEIFLNNLADFNQVDKTLWQ